MRKAVVLLLLALLIPACLAEANSLDYRYADAKEAAELLLDNRDFFDNMNQNDLNYRLQKTDATLAEMEAFAAAQVLDFTDEEKSRIDKTMKVILEICRERGYALPPLDGIVFAKTTMAEACYAGAYTHGTQIYLGESLLSLGTSDDPKAQAHFNRMMAHELFHCLTRNYPDFRAAMYAILGFTVVDDDYSFGQDVREVMISNPDVEHHNAYASFDINGEPTDCVVVFATSAPFRRPGDTFFDYGITGLVPIDDLNTMYTSDDAANFWDVFGKNTDYVIDPEETLADNFSFTLISGVDAMDYPTPEIIEAIDRRLKAGF